MIKQAITPVVETHEHRRFRADEFWRAVPAWADVTPEEFGNHLWQSKNSVTNLKKVKEVLGDRASDSFFEDVEAGLRKAPMNIRITPYVFSLIDWDNPVDDPLRKQFLPLGSQMLVDHPFYLADSLAEDTDAPVPMLTHRYPDKVLFLPLTTCPVYCSYCTRSRIIGGSTETVEKDTYGANTEKWEAAFQYLREHDIDRGRRDLRRRRLQHDGAAPAAHRREPAGDPPHPPPPRTRPRGSRSCRRRSSRTRNGSALSSTSTSGPTRWASRSTSTRTSRRHARSPSGPPTPWPGCTAEHVIVRNQAVLQDGVNNDIDIAVRCSPSSSRG